MVTGRWVCWAWVLWSAGPLGAAESVNSVGMTMVAIPAGKFTMGQDRRNLDYKWHCCLEIDQGADWDESPGAPSARSHGPLRCRPRK